jgi:hypothetical protein
MTRPEDRLTLVHLITEARAGGSRRVLARALAGIDPRTIQRWRKTDGLHAATGGRTLSGQRCRMP